MGVGVRGENGGNVEGGEEEREEWRMSEKG